MSITVLVLAVFFVLLFIGLIFYFGFSFESFKESESKILGERYNIYLSYITNLPELKCSFMGVEKECLDITKIRSFEGDNPYYKGVFEDVKRIYVQEIMPEKKEINIYGNSAASGEVHSTPISVYYPKEDKYVIGKLYVVV